MRDLSWLNNKNYPDVSELRLAQASSIDWKDVSSEDIEMLVYDLIDLSNVVSIEYADNDTTFRLIDAGFGGGYKVTYDDGTARLFGWLPYPDNDEPVQLFENIENATRLTCSSGISLSSLIPTQCKKYYKIDKTTDEDEIEELRDTFESADLEFVAPLIAKSKYYDVLADGEIAYVSLCKDSKGAYRVYSLTSYGAIDITNRVDEVIEKVKRDYRY